MMQGNNVVNGTAVSKFLRRGCIAVASTVISIVSVSAVAEQSITDISFNSQPNGQLSIELEFDSMPSSEFSSYTIEDPARIVIDFPDTKNQLPQRRYVLPSGNASSVVVLSAGDRSRMIVNLAQLGEFDAGIDGRRFVLDLGADSGGSYAVPAMSESVVVQTATASPSRSSAINDLEFRRGEDRRSTDPVSS